MCIFSGLSDTEDGLYNHYLSFTSVLHYLAYWLCIALLGNKSGLTDTEDTYWLCITLLDYLQFSLLGCFLFAIVVLPTGYGPLNGQMTSFSLPEKHFFPIRWFPLLIIIWSDLPHFHHLLITTHVLHSMFSPHNSSFHDAPGCLFHLIQSWVSSQGSIHTTTSLPLPVPPRDQHYSGLVSFMNSQHEQSLNNTLNTSLDWCENHPFNFSQILISIPLGKQSLQNANP